MVAPVLVPRREPRGRDPYRDFSTVGFLQWDFYSGISTVGFLQWDTPEMGLARFGSYPPLACFNLCLKHRPSTNAMGQHDGGQP